MSTASLMGGLALANAGLGAVHGIAAPLGGAYPISHGIACAALLPHVTAANIRAVWSQIVGEARAKSPMIGSLLAEAEVLSVDGRIVTLKPGNSGHAEGLERQRDTIAQAIGRYISEAPRVKISSEPGGQRTGPPASPERMTEERASAERLKSLRAKDPTLSAAVDALDLELLE